jgi:hypothetical protein
LGGGEGGIFLDTKGGVQTKILGKKIGTLKAGGGKKIAPLARIYTPEITLKNKILAQTYQSNY